MANDSSRSRRVLVGVDRSLSARVALKRAARRAGASGCLIVAHVMTPPWDALAWMAELVNGPRATGRKLVARLAADAGVDTDTRVMVAADHPRDAREHGHCTVVVGYDGSPPARAALAYAARRAAGGGRVVAVHAFHPAPDWLGEPYYQRALDSYQAHGRELLRSPEEQVDLGVEVVTSLLEGPPARVIVAAADARDGDEIVIGSRGFGRLRGVLGSVSHAVLDEAARPVVVIPADAVAPPSDR